MLHWATFSAIAVPHSDATRPECCVRTCEVTRSAQQVACDAARSKRRSRSGSGCCVAWTSWSSQVVLLQSYGCLTARCSCWLGCVFDTDLQAGRACSGTKKRASGWWRHVPRGMQTRGCAPLPCAGCTIITSLAPKAACPLGGLHHSPCRKDAPRRRPPPPDTWRCRMHLLQQRPCSSGTTPGFGASLRARAAQHPLASSLRRPPDRRHGYVSGLAFWRLLWTPGHRVDRPIDTRRRGCSC